MRAQPPTGGTPRSGPGRARPVGAVVVLLGVVLLLAGCGAEGAGRGDGANDPGAVVDGEIIADAAAYPGDAGPLVGVVARSAEEVAGVWSAVGFSGAVPDPDGGVVVVVAGGESGSCPWEPVGAEVAAQGTVVTVDLGDAGDQPCTDDWRPRALAVAVPSEALRDDVEVRVRRDGIENPVEPLDLEALDNHQSEVPSDRSRRSGAYLEVDVEVRASADASPTATRYACTADGRSAGDADADQACAALVDAEEWLLAGDPADQMCTQQYGGPEVADLRGEIDGQAFARQVDRGDGCGIARWDRLAPVLGVPLGHQGSQPPVTE